MCDCPDDSLRTSVERFYVSSFPPRWHWLPMVMSGKVLIFFISTSVSGFPQPLAAVSRVHEFFHGTSLFGVKQYCFCTSGYVWKNNPSVSHVQI